MRSICFLTDSVETDFVVMHELERRGWRVDASTGRSSSDDVRIEHDLYVVASSAVADFAALMAARGGRTLNDAMAMQRIRNNVWTDKFLRDQGMPIPESYLANAAGLEAILEDGKTLIIKAIEGTGVRVARNTDELLAAAGEACVYAQELKDGGSKRTIYVAGGEAFTPETVTTEVRDVALRTGELLGLEVYAVDMIEAQDGLWIVDVNGFRGFRALPEMVAAVADFIDRRARSGS